jgi:hypothetical protein
MKDAMTKLKQQAADLAARAAADAEEAAQFRANAEREYNSIASDLDVERQQVGWLGVSVWGAAEPSRYFLSCEIWPTPTHPPPPHTHTDRQAADAVPADAGVARGQ